MEKESDILDCLKKNQNIVVIYNSVEHEKAMIELHKAVSDAFKICMITIHKPFSSLIKKFQQENIDYSKYCFIDCISAKNSLVKDSKQCMYISSPTALTELALAMEKIKKKHKVDLIILDNISGFLLYNEEVAVLKFLHSMMTQIRKTDVKAIYSILKESKKEFIADLTLFADAIIKS